MVLFAPCALASCWAIVTLITSVSFHVHNMYVFKMFVQSTTACATCVLFQRYNIQDPSDYSTVIGLTYNYIYMM